MTRIDSHVPERLPVVVPVVAQEVIQSKAAKGIRPEIKTLISDYQKYLLEAKDETQKQTIKMHQSGSMAVFFYEKVRNVVDNKSDHLLRRNAIERITRRLLWENSRSDGAHVAKNLIRELIWGRYLESDSVSQNQLQKLIQVTEKYLFILNIIDQHDFMSAQEVKKFRLKIQAMSSAEIEEVLDPTLHLNNIWTRALARWFAEKYDWVDDIFTPEEKSLHIFLAIDRSLIKSDEARIYYSIVKEYLPYWTTMSANGIDSQITHLRDMFNTTERLLTSKTQARLYRFMTHQTAQFFIFRDILENNFANIGKILDDPVKLKGHISHFFTLRSKEINKKVTSGIVRSVIYIFFTKIFLIILLEIPFTVFTSQHVNFPALGVNAIVPPMLMFLLGLGIKKPGKKDELKLLDMVMDLVYKKTDQKIPISLIQKENKLANNIFKALYVALFTFCFGTLVYILLRLHFDILNIVVFFFFLSLVLLFGFRIQYSASEMNVTGLPDNSMTRLLSGLTLPFLNLGVWLSLGLNQLNFITVALDILIEMPLKTIVEITGEWANFIKEKRAEMVEVPIQ